MASLTTASKRPSGNGRAVAFPSTRVTRSAAPAAARFLRAFSSASGSMSSPVTRHPYFLTSSAVVVPMLHATSRTSVPGPSPPLCISQSVAARPPGRSRRLPSLARKTCPTSIAMSFTLFVECR